MAQLTQPRTFGVRIALRRPRAPLRRLCVCYSLLSAFTDHLGVLQLAEEDVSEIGKCAVHLKVVPVAINRLVSFYDSYNKQTKRKV